MLLRTVIRRIRNSTGLFVFKVLGLSVALLVVILISGWVFHELSYDTFFDNSGRIYRLSVEQVDEEINFNWHFARTCQTWRKDIAGYFPEIEEMAELVPMYTSNVKIGENRLSSQKGFATDSSFFKVFGLDFIQGDPVHAIDNSNTVVVSQSFAEAHFNSSSPVGKLMQIKGGGFDSFKEFIVTGVFKDLPGNCHFDIDFLLHYNPQQFPNWANKWAYTYYMLKEGAGIEDVQLKMKGFMKLHTSEYDQKTCTVHFMPLEDIHLKSNIEREIAQNGSIKQVYLFAIIGFAIIILVLLIYLNLCTVDFGKRIQNISVNRILGARGNHIYFHLIVEGFIVVLVAAIFAFLLVRPFSGLLQLIGIDTNYSIWNSAFPYMAVLVMFLIIVFTFASGFPLLVFSFRSNYSLIQKKGASILTRKGHNSLNAIMLYLQFSLSILVISIGFILAKQNNFVLSNQLGDKGGKIVSIRRVFTGDEYESVIFSDEISKLAEVAEVTSAMDNPTYLIKDMRRVETSIDDQGPHRKLLTICPVDEGFFDFFGIEYLAGRSFNPFKKEREHINYILNKSAIEQLGFESPQSAIGNSFKLSSFGNDLDKTGIIVGVVEDFYFSTLYHNIEPTAYFQMPKYYGSYFIKAIPGKEDIALNKVSQVWQEHFPEYNFQYEFLDDIYSQAYRQELVQGRMLFVFAFLSIFLSTTALIAITNMVFLKKTKEIGVRKVNGAKSLEVLGLFNKKYVLIILLAFLTSVPIAWFLMEKWLEGFAYKISIGIGSFTFAGMITLLVAIVTISWRGWKIVNKNPVEALRYE